MTPAERRAALETEAVRLKARLDRLNAQIEGDQDAWLDITVRMPETVAEVTVDRVLAEARQYALALATIVKTLDGTASQEVPAGPVADPADEIKGKREQKQREAAAKLAQGQ